MTMPLRARLRDAFEGARLNATHNVLRALPTDAVSAFGAWIGPIAGRRYAKINERARTALKALRPDLVPTEAAMQSALARMWQSQGRVRAEFAAEDRLWDEGRIAVEGREHLDAVKAAGRRVIVAGVHLANWEIVTFTLGHLGYRFVQTYQPQSNRFEDAIAKATRLRADARIRAANPDAGFTLLPPSEAAGPELLRAVRGGDGFMLYIDEYTGGSVHAPAFGRPIRTDGNMARVVRLARLADAAIIPAYAIRTEGARFIVRFLPPLLLRDTGDRAADLVANVAALDESVRPAILAHIEQWFMLIYFRGDR